MRSGKNADLRRRKIQNLQNHNGTEDPREDEPGGDPGAADPGRADLDEPVFHLLAVRNSSGGSVLNGLNKLQERIKNGIY